MISIKELINSRQHKANIIKTNVKIRTNQVEKCLVKPLETLSNKLNSPLITNLAILRNEYYNPKVDETRAITKSPQSNEREEENCTKFSSKKFSSKLDLDLMLHRIEVDKRFKNSKTNANYKFPKSIQDSEENINLNEAKDLQKMKNREINNSNDCLFT